MKTMRHTKSIRTLFVMLLLSGCTSEQLASWLPGTDPRIDQAPMRADTKSDARKYFNRANPKAFAFSPEKGTYWAQWGASTLEDAKESAIRKCEETTRTTCQLFAINNEIVWQPTAEQSVAVASGDKLQTTNGAPESISVTPQAAGPAIEPPQAIEDDLDRAIQEYSQILTLTPDDKAAIESLYIAYIRRAAAGEQNDEAMALSDYTHAIELQPSAYFAYKHRGQLQLRRGAAAAVADLMRAQEFEPEDAAIANLLAIAQQAVEVTDRPLAIEAAAEGPMATATPSQDSTLKMSKGLASVPQRSAAQRVSQPKTTEVSEINPRILPSQMYRVLTDVNMRQGPGNDYPSIRVIARNTTVSLVGERSGWLQIRLDDGSSGFVYRRWLAASS